MKLSKPIENPGLCLPTLAAMIACNLLEARAVIGLHLTDLRLPPSFTAACPSPTFGIERRRCSPVWPSPPLIATIVEPSTVLLPQLKARQVCELVDGGIDSIEVDELQADGSHSAFGELVRSVVLVVNVAADRTGKKDSGLRRTNDLDRMRRRRNWCRRRAAPASWATEPHAAGNPSRWFHRRLPTSTRHVG